MTRFFSAVSALQSSQRALEVLSNNIANANTPGFHRQVVALGNRTPSEINGLQIGNGVRILEVTRIRSEVIEEAINRNASGLGDIDAQLSGFTRAESQLATQEGSPNGLLVSLFNELELLSTRLNDSASRSVVVERANTLTTELNTLSREFNQTQANLRNEIVDTVAEVNARAEEVAFLNREIRRVENRGINANDLRDQRDQLITEIAERINVQVVEQNAGQATVFASGIPLAIDDRTLQIEAVFDQQGNATVRTVDTQTEIQITSGRLNGQLRLRNEVLPGVLSRLDTLAQQLIQSFDAVQATGRGIGGPITQSISQRAVNDIAVPLETAGLSFPAQAGSLFVGVTNLATSVRTITEVTIDPAAQQLGSAFPPATNPATSVVDAISAVANIQAITNSQTGQVTVLANSGFGFDFAGGFDSVPTTSVLTAPFSTAPQLSGIYTGSDNDTFSFAFSGAGTVGVTPGLRILVTDQAGNRVATLDVGDSYIPGSVLEVADGINLELSAGDVLAGDNFSIQVVANSDTASILTALGLNTFFTGNDASSIDVNPELSADPTRLASSRSGAQDDGLNLEELVSLRDALTLENGTQSFLEFATAITTNIAIEVQTLTLTQETNQLLGDRLESERQGLSGVDPNEELVEVIQFQRQFEIASLIIATNNETFDSLLRAVQ